MPTANSFGESESSEVSLSKMVYQALMANDPVKNARTIDFLATVADAIAIIHNQPQPSWAKNQNQRQAFWNKNQNQSQAFRAKNQNRAPHVIPLIELEKIRNRKPYTSTNLGGQNKSASVPGKTTIPTSSTSSTIVVAGVSSSSSSSSIRHGKRKFTSKQEELLCHINRDRPKGLFNTPGVSEGPGHQEEKGKEKGDEVEDDGGNTVGRVDGKGTEEAEDGNSSMKRSSYVAFSGVKDDMIFDGVKNDFPSKENAHIRSGGSEQSLAKKRGPFSKQENEQIEAGWREGKSWADIGALINRSGASVQQRWDQSLKHKYKGDNLGHNVGTSGSPKEKPRPPSLVAQGLARLSVRRASAAAAADAANAADELRSGGSISAESRYNRNKRTTVVARSAKEKRQKKVEPND
jgi:hypothetical protein